ncbi:MAG: SUMF1/EgtB/PvdO family nonheme iron enzyme, partial [Merismopedia sp. SIO2A8]|nr:SUMF1/EgtB/PvdO family nonheme iron enzyme [Merismopedia sp. SIO2A8]
TRKMRTRCASCVSPVYDMHGNVWEWCIDDWHENYERAPTDGSAWLDKNENPSQKNSLAVLRGGSWIKYPETNTS